MNTPAASTARPARSASSGSGRTPFILVAVIFLLIAGSLTVMAVLASGNVSGTEFSPTTFEVRQFSYYELPVVHLQLTPVERSNQSPVLDSFLENEKLLPPSGGSNVDWHLVSVERSGITVQEGDAELLVRYLQASGFGVNISVLDWSKKHPELAKAFWPVIIRIARRHEYILIPDVFSLALEAKTPQELSDSLHRDLAQRYQKWAEVEHEAGRVEVALDKLDEALTHAQNFPTLNETLTKQRQQWSAQ